MRMRIKGPELGCLHLRNLRFAFPMTALVEDGACGLSVGGFTRTLRAADFRRVAPLEMVSLSVSRHARLTLEKIEMTSRSQASIDASRTENASFSAGFFGLGNDDFLRKPLTMKLAAAVFLAPHLDWRLASASTFLRTLEGERIPHRLLQEGECFRPIVLTQRLMRILFDLSTGGTAIAASAAYGFADRCSLENAFHDQFCISLCSLNKMLDPRSQRRGGDCRLHRPIS